MVYRALCILLFPLIFLFAVMPISVFAQQTEEQLKAELVNLENEIKQLNLNLEAARKQGAGLKTDITLLEKKISESQLKIRSHQAKITSLNVSISEKDKTIGLLDDKLDREKESLAQILRKKKHLEAYTLLDFTLQEKSLSQFFSDRDSYSTLERALDESFDTIRQTRNQIEEVKSDLEDAKDEEVSRKLAQEAEKKKVETNQKEKNTLLTITKGQEKQFSKVIEVRQQEAARIRAKLFALRDSASIQFGMAYDYALAASKTTGVRPALVLAILMQESSLGKNVGSCYLTDFSTGNGIGIKTGETKQRVMNPSRDVPVFQDITRELGLDPTKTPVSCWIAMYSGGSPYGWGGAMGPSQFIPSTWKLMASRIKSSTGAAVANPWDAYHAITATSMFLADLGAGGGDLAGERNAACRYYSGKTCARSSDAAGYGNSVMRKLDGIQADIDTLQRS